MTWRRISRTALVVSLGAPFLCSPAVAELDLSGKRVEMTVPFSAGGGADAYGRFMAIVLEDALPGKPSIVIQNLPGGGSVVGMNQFDRLAEKDGTSIALSSTSTTLTFALRPEDPSIQFDARKWNAFLATPMGRVIYVHEKTGIKSLEDLKAKKDTELVIGLESPTGSDMPNLLSLEMLGLNVKPIFGFDGGDELLAFQRGELTINGDPMSGYLQTAETMVKDGTAIPLFSFGIENEKGEIVRDPNAPELPTFLEAYRLLQGKDPSGPAFEAWMALFHMAVMSSKAIVLPADASPEAIKAYDAAAAKLVADPDFQAKAVPVTGNYRSLPGEEARASLVKATTLSPEARTWLIDWLNTKHDAGL